MTEVDVPPVWCNTLNESLSMKDFLSKEIRQKNRQDLPQYYRVTGAVRIARWNDFQANNYDWYFDDSKALVIDRYRSIDIDSEEDFSYAEFLMHKGSRSPVSRNELSSSTYRAGRISAMLDDPSSPHILTHAHGYRACEGFELVGFVD